MHLQFIFLAVFPDLICDINTQMITKQMSSWIEPAGMKSDIAYFCLTKPSNIQLQFPDAQCVNNRMRGMCGHCPFGLDSMFGSLSCKLCSNVRLLLLPILLLAVALVVFSLFTINLKVVDGKISGILLYVSSEVGNSYNI